MKSDDLFLLSLDRLMLDIATISRAHTGTTWKNGHVTNLQIGKFILPCIFYAAPATDKKLGAVLLI
jgi:hypothetical protein